MVVVVLGALIIGLTLGMLGSGGSAITVPLLVYLVGHGAKESIAESMAIVAIISVAAAIPYAKSNEVEWRSVIYFGIPGMFGALLGAWAGGLAAGELQLVVFSIVLLGAAISMFRQSRGALESTNEKAIPIGPSIGILGIQGAVVGSVTGFVGVGGGFLIVPALVVLGKLPIRRAMGTSLVIIILNAVVGFAKYEQYLLAHNSSVDLQTIAVFGSVGIAGSFIGRSINTRLNQTLLRQVFAVFLILLGSFVLIKEGNKLLVHSPKPETAHSITSDSVTQQISY